MPDSTPTASTERKPSGRQIYSIAYALLEIAGLDAPKTRADASQLIEQLAPQRTAIRAAVAPDAISEF